jgi:hypothetical protein
MRGFGWGLSILLSTAAIFVQARQGIGNRCHHQSLAIAWPQVAFRQDLSVGALNFVFQALF